MCKSIIDCEPREEAAYVRKLLRDAGQDVIPNTPPCSYEDMYEVFRAELIDAPNRPDDGVIAACVFVYCLARFPTKASSSLPRNHSGDFSEQDIINNIKAVSYMLCRFISVTDDIAAWYRTIHQLLDRYFYNQSLHEKGKFFVFETPSLQSCFARVCGMLADISGQDYPTMKSRSPEYALEYYDVMETFVLGLNGTDVSLVIFHALLYGFYQERTPEKFSDMLMKCAMLGLTIENIFSDDIAKLLMAMGLAVPDNIEKFYSHVYKNISNSEFNYDYGLFSRLLMINR